MSVPPRVAVVVVSYEVRATLVAGLHQLERAAGLPVETVVVDNASRDGSADAVRAAFPAVRVVANSDNVGFARASNQGAQATSAPLLLFLNPDATLEPGALAALVALVESRPRVGAAGPRIRGEDGTIEVSTGPDLSLASEWRQRRLVQGVRRRDPAALAEAEARHAREHAPDWLSGACLLVRREAFRAVSGFDERFFLYEEDADLCRRLRAAGWQVVFTPAAEARHARGASMAGVAGRARLEYHRSHLTYYATHNGLLQQAGLRALLVARGALDLARGLLSSDAARGREARALLGLALRRRLAT